MKFANYRILFLSKGIKIQESLGHSFRQAYEEGTVYIKVKGNCALRVAHVAPKMSALIHKRRETRRWFFCCIRMNHGTVP